MPKSQGTSRKGKPKKAERASGMGRALKKSQGQKFKVKSNGASRHGAGMQASGAANIGISNKSELEASNNGIKSVLEVDDLTDFLAKAELANREFASEREQFLVLDDVAQQVVVGGVRMPTHREMPYDDDDDDEDDDEDDDDDDSPQEGENDTDFRIVDKHRNKQQQLANMFDFRELAVPRRPKWDHTTTPEQLDQNEKEAFLEWRRAIALKEEQIMASKSITAGSANSVSVTPFEKNLQVWRQLWRVLERSDCIVLVVDGRNPLFYISMDLRTYVEEELGKSLIVVVNKCDYLSEKQRFMWHQHFLSMDGLEHVFFSAVAEQKVLDEEAKIENDDNFLKSETVDNDGQDIDDSTNQIKQAANHTHKERSYGSSNDEYPTVLDPETIGIRQPLRRKELLDILCKYNKLKGTGTKSDKTSKDDDDDDNDAAENTSVYQNARVEFGMVGFPNVGKSSVLNVLVGASKNDHKTSRVGVASQPGKTKHFQTLNVPDYENITLCDCPGLVFPSFVSSQADLILAGVYPLSQVRDFWPAVELICRRIPREILEVHFGVELPRPSVLDIAQRGGQAALNPPTAEELLTAYCIARSLLAASSGIPDFHKASRVVLRDYVSGNILFCHCPPEPNHVDGAKAIGKDQWEEEFYRETISTALQKERKLRERLEVKVEEARRQQQQQQQQQKQQTNDGEHDFDDLDIFDVIGEDSVQTGDNSKPSNGGKRGKKHKSMQKWGKKGRKNRNKDPYGCHTEPDAELFGAKGGSGLVVSAGKYSSSNYTRPSYKGTRSAVQ